MVFHLSNDTVPSSRKFNIDLQCPVLCHLKSNIYQRWNSWLLFLPQAGAAIFLFSSLNYEENKLMPLFVIYKSLCNRLAFFFLICGKTVLSDKSTDGWCKASEHLSHLCGRGL